MSRQYFFFLMSIGEKHIERLADDWPMHAEQYFFFREKEFVYIYCLNMSKGHVSRYFRIGITGKLR